MIGKKAEAAAAALLVADWLLYVDAVIPADVFVAAGWLAVVAWVLGGALVAAYWLTTPRNRGSQ
ncbi:hypothetical protein [Nocardia sp. NPDC057455]|uniref:hypothetical protein n=1 Tax=Nocardia sp. NPDC057455 TaxID=3346138 RepID=UPI0036726C6D